MGTGEIKREERRKGPPILAFEGEGAMTTTKRQTYLGQVGRWASSTPAGAPSWLIGAPQVPLRVPEPPSSKLSFPTTEPRALPCPAFFSPQPTESMKRRERFWNRLAPRLRVCIRTASLPSVKYQECYSQKGVFHCLSWLCTTFILEQSRHPASISSSEFEANLDRSP